MIKRYIKFIPYVDGGYLVEHKHLIIGLSSLALDSRDYGVNPAIIINPMQYKVDIGQPDIECTMPSSKPIEWLLLKSLNDFGMMPIFDFKYIDSADFRSKTKHFPGSIEEILSGKDEVNVYMWRDEYAKKYLVVLIEKES